MRHLGKVSIALVVLATACNMYGDKAPRPKNPVPRTKTLAEITKEKEAEKQASVVVDIEECNYVTSATPPNTKAATRAPEHERNGDARTVVFKGAAGNVEVQKGALIDVIDEYGRALAVDPYNPDLTLKLADAYDKAQRKGCALALLGRLAKMSNNPKFSKKADLVIDTVIDQKGYFSRYRPAAIRAVGR
jgi:hypothetical protein